MMQFAHKDVYQCWLLFQPIPKPIRKAAAFIITQFSINYCGIQQNALLYANGMRYMQATYFYIPLHLVSVLVATRGLGLLRYAIRLDKKRAEK